MASSRPLSRPTPQRRRGFTIMEMMVVVAVVGIIGGMAAFAFGSMSSRRGLHDAAREVVSQIHRLRSAGVSGRLGDTTAVVGGGGGGPLNASLDGTTGVFLQTGIRVDNDQTLTFFGATGGAAGGATDILSVIDLDEEYPNSELRVTQPTPGDEIRFERNAILADGSLDTVTLTDQRTGRQVQIRITLAGVPRIL